MSKDKTVSGFGPIVNSSIPVNTLGNNQVETGFGQEGVVAVLDGDELAFKMAAACEERGILVTNLGNSATASFKNRTEFKDFLKGLEVPDDFYTITDTQIAESTIIARGKLKRAIINLCKKLEASKYEIYIGGTSNFRDTLPLPKPYKGNREGLVKPLLLSDLKEYLVRFHKAVIIEGKEADDQLTTRMYEGSRCKENIIAVTQDKDATATPGFLYNPTKNTLTTVKGLGELYIDDTTKTPTVKGFGRRFLYFQVIFGDSADHYDPRDLVEIVTGKKPRFGEKTAYNLLKDLKNDVECITAITDLYKKWFGDKPFTYEDHSGESHTGTYIDAMQLYWDCAHMQRWEGDRVDVRALLKKLEVSYEI